MPKINSNTENAPSGKYSELPLRIASAAVLAAFAIFCTWMGGETFRLLSVAISLLIFFEFREMTKSQLPFLVGLFALGFLFILFGSYFVDRAMSGLSIVGIGCVLLAIWEWLVRRSVWGSILLVYSALPFAALVDMRAGNAGLFVILFVFACVWGADTFAYFSGKTFGGPKLALSISPNKTWSGFIGGVGGAILISALLEVVFDYSISLLAVMLAIALAIFSQIGDLFESWVKRKFGLKDSSKLIPGHGGVLDRIDGLIFAIVGAWLIGLLLDPQAFATNAMADVLIKVFF